MCGGSTDHSLNKKQKLESSPTKSKIVVIGTFIHLNSLNTRCTRERKEKPEEDIVRGLKTQEEEEGEL